MAPYLALIMRLYLTVLAKGESINNILERVNTSAKETEFTVKIGLSSFFIVIIF